MGDLNELIAEVTEAIGGIIQKPKMTEKLLSKPPFRFLHDVITAVTGATGYAHGLYDDAELNAAGITERQQKIDYLDKIINMVGLCSGKPIDIRSAKVVAGLEPECTNAFLLALARCAKNSSINNAAMVERTLAGEQPGAYAAPTAAAKSEAKANYDDSKGSRGGVDDYAAAERGKSRGGTRGGKPNQKESGAAAAGLAGFDDVPPNLDSEIQLCDGTEATTQSMLGSLISKPKLTDKLLQKPPFRFLYDIIMQVIETTEFGKGLYFGEELDSANISDKDKKILYLEKMIRLVGQSLGTIVEAKPAKIVAGQDPQSTNNFLQLLSLAARHIKNSAKTVRIVLEQVGQGEQAAAISAPSSAPAHSPLRAQAKHDEDDNPSTRLAPAGSKGFAPPSDESRSQVRPKERDAEETTEVDGQADSKSAEPTGERSMRPTTARRRPPKVKDGAKEVTAKDVSAPTGKRAEGILIDGQDDDDDEDIPGESRLIDDIRADAKDSSGGASAPQSKLVKDIMSRQVEQEAAAKGLDTNEKDPGETTESKDATGGIRLGRLRKTGTDKKGQTVAAATGTAGPAGTSGGSSLAPNDLDRLRTSIQGLVQQIGPLGTCMDFIHEDVGLMAAELNRWEEECRKYDVDLQAERRKTDLLIKPLQMELSDIEEQVKEQTARITAMKASIAKNESRIQQQLKFVATA